MTSEQLVLDHMDYARRVSVKFVRDHIRHLDYDEAIQLGYVGLIKAARSFKTEHKSGANFKTYAYPWIKGEIQMECENLQFVKKNGREKGITFEMQSLDFQTSGEDGEVGWELEATKFDADQWMDFISLMKTLSEREQEVLLFLAAGYTTLEITQMSKVVRNPYRPGPSPYVTRERVYQIAREARQKLNHRSSVRS